jgi:hypothetical protein
MIEIAILLLQALSPSEAVLQRRLLDAAGAQLADRQAAANSATVDRMVSEEYYYACIAARVKAGTHGQSALDACAADYDAVVRRAVTAEIAWTGVQFDRTKVEQLLANVRKEARRRAGL